ncbi:DUF3280 domain-containing protein [Methylocystis sp. MJC1]|jgi:hypothetical protein|uniref:DUF3280 domain-containing protein n=1 Tax=Methylocystis sp. MJC1 TaxID=2654282 RepID=UPI001FEE82E6|nr:DUF3280 domain-containing protein [Methylocystis sp. MJC1]KAF2991301.1 hypothetical protein MJC1_01650 [Methylocystis sp. MJC1]UZX12613.1 DUF3280 domain-containing protein [Methylocystis sp. MJC1]
MMLDRRRLIAATALLPFAARAQAGIKTGKRLLVLDFEIIDTSNEPIDQRADHARRLTDVRNAIASGLAAQGTYEIVDRAVVQEALDRTLAQTYIRTCNCAAALGKEAGADLVMTGLVNKVSTLILSLGVSITRVSSGELIFHQGFDFRGDNDQSYARAAKFFTERLARDPAI